MAKERIERGLLTTEIVTDRGVAHVREVPDGYFVLVAAGGVVISREAGEALAERLTIHQTPGYPASREKSDRAHHRAHGPLDSAE
jgi:hypothetical protein